MDLLERGRLLSELGRSMRWTDLIAFLRYAPPTSNYRRVIDPDGARREEYQIALMEPTSRILGELFDQVQWLRQGVPDEHGIIFRLLARAYDVDPDELAREIGRGREGDAGEVAPQQKKRKTAAEIRAQIKAASQKK